MPDNAPPQSSIVLYQTEDVRTINEHLVNVFAEGELSREANIRKFRIVRQEGAREAEITELNRTVVMFLARLLGPLPAAR